MSRSVTVYGVLLVAALVGSYLTWTHEPTTRDAPGATVADIPAETVEAVRYEAPRREIVVTRRRTDGQTFWWVESTRKGETDKYRASPTFDRFLDDLQPLRAKRRLPNLDDDRRKAFGFDDPSTLTISTKTADERTFEIGERTYGGRYVYLHDTTSGEGFVVGGELVGPFDFASEQLREKRLVAFGEDDAASVQLEYDGRQLDLVRRNRDDPTAAYWSRRSSPTRKSRAVQSWVERFFRLEAEDYIEGAAPSGLTTRVTATVESTEGETSSVELSLRDTGNQTAYFAESDLTRRLVSLDRSAASGLIGDIPRLFDEPAK
jgi:hypothetical protein